MIDVADLIIIASLIAVGYAGVRNGIVRQLTISLSMLAGLYAMLLVYHRVAFLAENSGLRTVVLVLLLLAVGSLFYGIAIRLGELLRRKLHLKKQSVQWWDKTGGSAIAVVSTGLLIWFAAAVFGTGSLPDVVARQLRGSGFLTAISRVVDTPAIAKTAGGLLQPFGTPDVFVGNEPVFKSSSVSLSSQFDSLDAAIERAKPLTLKVNAWGCGSKISGSGFLVGPNLIATNAHVVAGVDRMSVQATTGTNYTVRAVWFDASQDIAILRTESDLGKPLAIASQSLAPGAISAIIGYPGGGDLTASDAIILERLDATGYDIYDKQQVVRNLYAVRSDVLSGDSGGPLINAKGDVVGLVIGHSTAQAKTGYALSAAAISEALSHALQQKEAVGTAACRG